MLSSIFWTEPRFTGVVLILGSLLFGGGGGLYWPIKDEKGSFIFGLPPREWLRLVFAHRCEAQGVVLVDIRERPARADEHDRADDRIIAVADDRLG